MDWQPIYLTFKLAFVSTILLAILSLPLAYWLAHTRTKAKALVETLVSMPLVLPPTVIGFYLLCVFSPTSGLGSWLNTYLGIQFLFTFKGLVLASLIYSLPFMVHPLQAGFSKLDPSLREASYLLGKSKWATIFKVLLPSMKPAVLTGLVLTFAHTIGEFGLVLMIGGNIPGQTKVASVAIYDEVEALNYATAHQYAFVLFALTFGILLLVYSVNAGFLKRFWK